jgi:hypothetical protein
MSARNAITTSRFMVSEGVRFIVISSETNVVIVPAPCRRGCKAKASTRKRKAGSQ